MCALNSDPEQDALTAIVDALVVRARTVGKPGLTRDLGVQSND